MRLVWLFWTTSTVTVSNGTMWLVTMKNPSFVKIPRVTWTLLGKLSLTSGYLKCIISVKNSHPNQDFFTISNMGYYLFLFICQIGFLKRLFFWIKTHFAYKPKQHKIFFSFVSFTIILLQFSFAFGMQNIMHVTKKWLIVCERKRVHFVLFFNFLKVYFTLQPLMVIITRGRRK